MSKIKKTNTEKEIRQIHKTTVSKEINFSYKYFCTDNEKFCIKKQDTKYFLSLLEKLKGVSSFSEIEIKTNGSKSLRCHKLDWQETSEKTGFGILGNNEFNDNAYQISISQSEHGRIHGFFIANTFFIVWLDPHHRLYSRR